MIFAIVSRVKEFGLAVEMYPRVVDIPVALDTGPTLDAGFRLMNSK